MTISRQAPSMLYFGRYPKGYRPELVWNGLLSEGEEELGVAVGFFEAAEEEVHGVDGG
jgi:hypothetical protein